MVYICAIFGCHACTRKMDLKKYPFMKGVFWVKFPTQTAAKAKWARLCHRGGKNNTAKEVDNFKVTPQSRICSRHFMTFDLLGKPIGPPSLFPWNNYGVRRATDRPGIVQQKLDKARKAMPIVTVQDTHPRLLHPIPQPASLIKLSAQSIHVGTEVLVCNINCDDKPVVGDMVVLSFPTPSPSEDHIYCRCEERTDTDNIEKSDAKQTQTYFKTTKDKALYQPGQPFVEKVLANARNVNHYTGVTNKGLLEALFSSLEFGVPNLRYWNSSRNTTHTRLHTGPSRKLILFYEFIMTLVRIKLNLSVTLLGHLFDVSPTSVTGITLTWINYLDLALVPVLVYWPTKEQVQANMPSAFRCRYPKTRVVIDATEFAIDKIHNPDGQYATYSQYKSTNTLKVLVGVSPCGSFTFIGDVWSENSSDKFVTANSKLISLLEPGDEVMADRGFWIEDLLLKKNCRLTAPPFTRRVPNAKNKRLNVSEIRKTAIIANLRMHVERAIQRLKTFRMLRQRMPVSLKVVAGQVVRIAAGLCNLKPQLIRKR